MGNYELRGKTSFWEKRTVTWPRLLKYRIPKDPDVPPIPCWETGTNQMHKIIYTPGGVNKSPLCSLLLPTLAIHLLYNAVAARGLLGRTDKNIICHFLATEVAVYFYNNKLLL